MPFKKSDWGCIHQFFSSVSHGMSKPWSCLLEILFGKACTSDCYSYLLKPRHSLHNTLHFHLLTELAGWTFNWLIISDLSSVIT